MDLPNLIAYGIIGAVAGLALFIILKVGQKLLKVLAVVFLVTVGYYFIQGGSATEIRESLDDTLANLRAQWDELVGGEEPSVDEEAAEVEQ
jgi:uncharacterized membrane protein YfcA